MTVKEIILKHGEVAIVDEDSYEMLSKYSWYSVKSRGALYAKSGKNTRMHRLILNISDSKLVVDHINGNGLDNRKQNLRVISSSENVKNRQRSSVGKRCPGVYKVYNKWRAEVTVNYKNCYLGMHASEEEAINAINKFRISIGRPPVIC